jgi:predicted TIM-barrel fold metal-dependent hydrolase
MIIDTHVHLGYDCVFDSVSTEEELVSIYSKNGVGGALIQPFTPRPYVEENREYHDRIYRFAKDASHGLKVWGIANPWPHFTQEDYWNEAQRCVKELGFVGIKMNTFNNICNPISKNGAFVFETANKLNVPIMIHTGSSGLPFSNPYNCIKYAKMYPGLKIVLAHAGLNTFNACVIDMALEFENIFLETTWVNVNNIKKLINALGTSKLMVSSDHAVNISVELQKYRALELSDDQLDQVFAKTAIDVFNLTI